MSIDKKAICVGMMTCDSYYYDVDTDFLEKENSTASHIRMSAGGDATNVSIDLARMGFHSCLMGLIGNDFHGDGLVKTVTEAGVDPSYIIRKPDVETTMTMILTIPLEMVVTMMVMEMVMEMVKRKRLKRAALERRSPKIPKILPSPCLLN